MKILLPVKSDSGLDSQLDGRFGRGDFFMIYDLEQDSIASIMVNTYKNEPHGAGIKAATYLVESGCDVLIGAVPGPKASAVLNEAGVKSVTMSGCTAGDAIRSFKSGQ